jgi:hypothetical protein
VFTIGWRELCGGGYFRALAEYQRQANGWSTEYRDGALAGTKYWRATSMLSVLSAVMLGALCLIRVPEKKT